MVIHLGNIITYKNYPKQLNCMKKVLLKSILLVMVCLNTIHVYSQNKYKAPKATIAPTIDGIGTDACWSSAPWYNVDQVWLGATPTAADFTEKFKVSWDANKLYVLAEVTDDVLNDNYTDPLVSYWEDDTWEIFIDENNSGGDHERNYNAFAYHFSRSLDAVDIGIDGNPHLLNSNVTVQRTANGNVYTWEASFDIYTDAFVLGANNNPKVVLTAGKIMGFAMAYCDNDGGTARQSFIGSETIAAVDKNVAYRDANVFGDLELVDNVSLTGTFSNVMVANGITNPTSMAIAPDGRVFICEQSGNLKVVKNGALLNNSVLNVNINLGNQYYSERGLLGVTLDPNFATNNYIYVFYTTSNSSIYTAAGAHNRVSRFTLNGDVAVNGSELILLELDGLSTAINHNGGMLQFGKDGKLYIGTGENANQPHAQNLDNTHGKILRINSDGTIPTDNPFTTGTTQRKMIWAYGLRNPFTFDVQPGTGRFLINDVGQDTWEEINDATIAGQNFGWPGSEGATTNPAYSTPLFNYRHSANATDTTGCAITGGCFFNPISSNYPSAYNSKYFYLDFCNNWIAVMDPVTKTRTEVFAKNIPSAAVALEVHPDGNIYFLSRTNNALYKITYSGDPAPAILSQPASVSVAESQSIQLKVVASGTAPITYLWKKNGVTIANATSDVYSISSAVKADSGKYTVVVTNGSGFVLSNEAVVKITNFNSRPVAEITSPVTNSKYEGGKTYVINGSANDVQDGELPASAYTWKVDLHHDTHIHDGIPTTGLKTLDLKIPSNGETATNVFFRVTLIVTDLGGLKDTSYIDLLPTIVNLTFVTVPAGLKVSIDGQPVTTPATVESVVGVDRNIGIVASQTLNSKGWGFLKWSNDGTESQVLNTPLNNQTYTATFGETEVVTEMISPIKDAYTTSGTTFATGGPTTTYGTVDSTQLIVKNYNLGPNRLSYLGFNLSKLAGNSSKIKSVKLKFNASMTDEDITTANSIVVNVYESISNLWEEKTITYNNMPGNNAAILGTTTAVEFIDVPYTIDITNFIKPLLLNQIASTSLVLAATSDSKNRLIINSKESAGSKPQLVFEYENVTSIDDIVESTSLVLYPNPAFKTVGFKYDGKEHGIGSLEIYNSTSTLVSTENIQINSGTNVYSISISNLSSGIYFVKFILNNKIYVEKLIVK